MQEALKVMSNISEERIREASECLADAECVYAERISNPAVMTKLYYVMLYSLFALFRVREIGTLTHADLFARFEREYISQGTFKKELLDGLIYASEFLQECNCTDMKEPEDADIERLLPVAGDFLSDVSEYLKNPGGSS